MAVKVCIKTAVFAEDSSSNKNEPFEYVRDAVASRGKQHGYIVADSPDDADIVLHIETPQYKDWNYGPRLLQNADLLRLADKTFVFEFADGPAGFLSGVYPSLKKTDADPKRFRSGGYLIFASDIIGRAQENYRREPQLLFSFRGFASHPVREEIFKTDFGRSDVYVEQTTKWFTHNEQDRLNYIEQTLNSRFVLCPCGQGTSSVRLFETLAAGRVPVIVSDEWVEPSGPEWNRFSVRVPQNRVREIPSILARYEEKWPEMAEAARQTWHDWYAPDVTWRRLLEAVQAIQAARPVGYNERGNIEASTGWLFLYKNGWTVPQRAVAAVRRKRTELVGRLRRETEA